MYNFIMCSLIISTMNIKFLMIIINVKKTNYFLSPEDLRYSAGVVTRFFSPHSEAVKP